MTVFKAHITTNPASDVLDMFWIYDNRHELPDHHRCARPPLPSRFLTALLLPRSVALTSRVMGYSRSSEELQAGLCRTTHLYPRRGPANAVIMRLASAAPGPILQLLLVPAASVVVLCHAGVLRSFSVRRRVLEISDQVRQVLNQPHSQCTITPAPADSAEADSAVALAKRCLCKVPVLRHAEVSAWLREHARHRCAQCDVDGTVCV